MRNKLKYLFLLISSDMSCLGVEIQYYFFDFTFFRIEIIVFCLNAFLVY